MNGLCPFFIQWARNAAEKGAAAAIWLLCVAYTIASAVGFAAENRAHTTGAHVAEYANLQTVQEMLADELAAKKKNPKRITDLRERIIAMRTKGAAVEPDSQADVLARLIAAPPGNIRTALVVLFALLIEIGAALGLYASLSHLTREPDAAKPAETWHLPQKKPAAKPRAKVKGL